MSNTHAAVHFVAFISSRPPRRWPLNGQFCAGHKNRTANAIAKSKARVSAIPSRIAVCAFGRCEGGFCGGCTSHTQPAMPFLSRTPAPPPFSAMNSTPADSSLARTKSG